MSRVLRLLADIMGSTPFVRTLPSKLTLSQEVFMSKRKRYSPELKQEAIELARRSGASSRQGALEIGVSRHGESRT